MSQKNLEMKIYFTLDFFQFFKANMCTCFESQQHIFSTDLQRKKFFLNYRIKKITCRFDNSMLISYLY